MTGPAGRHDHGKRLPFVPCGDGAKLAVTLRAVQWTLDDVAHDVPAGRATPDGLHGLAVLLRQLADHLDVIAGIVPGETD